MVDLGQPCYNGGAQGYCAFPRYAENTISTATPPLATRSQIDRTLAFGWFVTRLLQPTEACDDSAILSSDPGLIPTPEHECLSAAQDIGTTSTATNFQVKPSYTHVYELCI